MTTARQRIDTQLARSIKRLEQDSIRLREGKVTQVDPLRVQLSGAVDGEGDPIDSPMTANLGQALAVDDRVFVMRKGSTTLVLGRNGAPETPIVGGDQVFEDSIEAKHIFVETLDAITGDFGTMTAGTIEGVTITGGLFRTAESGIRWEMDSDAIIGYDVSENEKFKFDLATGNLAAAGTITTESGSVVDGDHIVDDTIIADKLNVGTLDAITGDFGEMTSGIVTGAEIRTAASGARVLMNSTVGIKMFNASEEEQLHFDLTTGIISVTAVISTLDGSVIPTDQLSGTITETQIDDDSISTPKLQANSVTTDEIFVTNLAAINADLGEVTAGTLTGTLFQTSSSNPRVWIDSTGFEATHLFGFVTVDIPADGSTATFREVEIEGDLKATALELRASATPSQDNTIVWVDDSDNIEVSQTGIDGTVGGIPFQRWGAVTNEFSSGGLSEDGEIGLHLQKVPSDDSLSYAIVEAGTFSAIILDVAGNSDFLMHGPRETVIFTADGTFSKADYPWLKGVRIRTVGGGGKGGSAASTGSGQSSAGQSASGGGYAESVVAEGDLGSSETVTVGAGGTSNPSGNGEDGGASSFGSHAAANGGAGGGIASATSTSVPVGGRTGGAATAGDIQIRGGSSQIGLRNVGGTTRCYSGSGGDSMLGSGGLGVAQNASSGSDSGNNGDGYGSGGSGGANGESSSGQSGGHGADGIVILELYG